MGDPAVVVDSLVKRFAAKKPKLFEFGAGTVTGHLLTGDDRDGPDRAAQRPSDGIRITDLIAPRAGIAYRGAVDLALLNVLGQQ